jgi:hypothetical protein
MRRHRHGVHPNLHADISWPIQCLGLVQLRHNLLKALPQADA